MTSVFSIMTKIKKKKKKGTRIKKILISKIR